MSNGNCPTPLLPPALDNRETPFCESRWEHGAWRAVSLLAAPVTQLGHLGEHVISYCKEELQRLPVTPADGFDKAAPFCSIHHGFFVFEILVDGEMPNIFGFFPLSVALWFEKRTGILDVLCCHCSTCFEKALSVLFDRVIQLHWQPVCDDEVPRRILNKKLYTTIRGYMPKRSQKYVSLHIFHENCSCTFSGHLLPSK